MTSTTTTAQLAATIGVAALLLAGCSAGVDTLPTGTPEAALQGCGDKLPQWMTTTDRLGVDTEITGTVAGAAEAELLPAGVIADCAFASGDGNTIASAVVFLDEPRATEAFTSVRALFEGKGYFLATEASSPVDGEFVTFTGTGQSGEEIVTIQLLEGALVTSSFGMTGETRVLVVQRSAAR